MKLRPRFTLRTLAIVVTLVCVYFGAWEATKRWGVPLAGEVIEHDSQKYARISSIESADSPIPLIVRHRESDWDGKKLVYNTRYYLWLFGPKIKLPIEHDGQRDSSYSSNK